MKKYIYLKIKITYLKYLILIKMGIGDWGLGIGDWAHSPIPNPQSPIPNPQNFLAYYFYLKTQIYLLIYTLFN